MTFQYSFKDLLQRAERITWRVEDLIGGDKKLDFSRPFMPESFARTGELDFLDAPEKLTLSQIRGNTYLAMFGVIEEFILPFVLDHARPFLNGEDYRARAFLEFASEEAKHIHLFRRFAEEFRAGFGVECQVIGPPAAIGAHVLAQPPLAVALLVLQIEWMTQRHFQDSVSDDATLDPQFKSLLLHHWMEEHQHAQLDALMTLAIAENMSDAEIDAAFDAYFALGGFFDEGLKQQTLFELDALERSIGRTLNARDREAYLARQHQANRWTYLGSGMTHPRFLETAGKLSAAKRAAIEAAAPGFC
jgi:hypothetical protein